MSTIQCQHCGQSVPEKSAFCPYCGCTIELTENPVAENPYVGPPANTPKKNSRTWLYGIVATLVTIILILGGILLYLQHQEAEATRRLAETERLKAEQAEQEVEQAKKLAEEANAKAEEAKNEAKEAKTQSANRAYMAQQNAQDAVAQSRLNRYSVIVGSFQNPAEAERFASTVSNSTGYYGQVVPFNIRNKGRWYRVIAYTTDSYYDAQNVCDNLKYSFNGAWVLTL